jgi:hypothetical protein
MASLARLSQLQLNVHESGATDTTGTVNVNGAFLFAPNAPFGDYKQSGIGLEIGREGLLGVGLERFGVSDPVVAGPTMFGFILAHWDELARGAPLPIRFAVIERRETIGFTLAKVDSAPGVTTIRMNPSSLVVRLLWLRLTSGSIQIRERFWNTPAASHRLKR